MEAEQFNYSLAKTQFDESEKAKKNRFYHSSSQPDLNRDLREDFKKEENLYLYYSNIGKKMMSKETPKQPKFKGSKILQGVYSPKLSGSNFQFGHTKSLVDLKRTGNKAFGDKSIGRKIEKEAMMKQFTEILKSRKGNRKYHRSSMGTLPSALTGTTPVAHESQPKHYPTRRIDQNKLMFNEIFVKPKMDQLKKLEYQREQEFKKFKLPHIKQLKQTPSTNEPEDDDFVRETLVKERQTKLKEANKNEKSLDISSLLERRRFNKNTDNLFGDDEEEDAFKTIDKIELEQLKDSDIKELQNKVGNVNKNQYDFQNYLIQSTEDYQEEEENDIIRIIMAKFNSKAKRKAVGSFFTQQIQVQPPEGLINIIGSEGSWAPSIPLSKFLCIYLQILIIFIFR